MKLLSGECHNTSLIISQTLVQVMAWCRQATSHYLSQCWPKSLLPYEVTRPQWVKQSCGSNTISASMMHKMAHKKAWNRSALDSILVTGASNRDTMVCLLGAQYLYVRYSCLPEVSLLWILITCRSKVVDLGQHISVFQELSILTWNRFHVFLYCVFWHPADHILHHGQPISL